MKAFQKEAASVVSATQPTAMLLNKIEEQFLWCNTICSPGYRIDLQPKDANQSQVVGLKVDPSDRAAVEKWKSLIEGWQPGGDPVDADVYFDAKNQPVAVSVNGSLAWKAGWWGT